MQAVDACIEAARSAYAVADAAAVLPVAGAQAAIQRLPRLRSRGHVAVLGPTYNEHAAAFAAEGWRVTETGDLATLAQADAAVVVNPNNPDGRRTDPETLLALAGRVGLLVVDESFADVEPARSLCPMAGQPGLVVLRSFGKFHGLAGLRLGFAIGTPADMEILRALEGPWSVSGPALVIGAMALADRAWADATRQRLAGAAARLDRLALEARWRPVGGTTLFRLYEAHDATAARSRLAAARIWSRIFPWSPSLVRLGMPGETEWDRLAAVLAP
jgi:cobalamin biosynthetic protein CobC